MKGVDKSTWVEDALKQNKQKVARDLKYGNGETDLKALAQELKTNRTKEEEMEAAWAQLEEEK